MSAQISRISRNQKNPNILGIYPDVELLLFPYLLGLYAFFQTPTGDQVTASGASQLHQIGLTSDGVTVAVLDSGLWPAPELTKDSKGNNRILGYFDVLLNRIVPIGSTNLNIDLNGHGTHLTSLIANSEVNKNNNYNGIAPDVDLVIVRAFDSKGKAHYSDVIAGIEWIITNREVYDIRVINLSFSTTPLSSYWDDPLNQALMKAWQAGIVVVAAVGNDDPDPMTIGVPGNVPYIITAGAFSGNHTPLDNRDDYLASFSSAGSTVEGFVKPEVVAPGHKLVGHMPYMSALGMDHPERHVHFNYYSMSGTSQATAITSGLVALILQQDPSLSPDDIKWRLIAGAFPVLNATNQLTYSIFQQGAGFLDAVNIYNSTAFSCANIGMDINKDLAGEIHYGGRANRDDVGNYYIMDLNDNYVWDGRYAWVEGFIWGESYAWGEAYILGKGYVWGEGWIWGE